VCDTVLANSGLADTLRIKRQTLAAGFTVGGLSFQTLKAKRIILEQKLQDKICITTLVSPDFLGYGNFIT
jgi:hypothetical protein